MPKVLVTLSAEMLAKLDALAGRGSRSAVIEGLLERSIGQPVRAAIVAARVKVSAKAAAERAPFRSRLKGEWKAP